MAEAINITDGSEVIKKFNVEVKRTFVFESTDEATLRKQLKDDFGFEDSAVGTIAEAGTEDDGAPTEAEVAAAEEAGKVRPFGADVDGRDMRPHRDPLAQEGGPEALGVDENAPAVTKERKGTTQNPKR